MGRPPLVDWSEALRLAPRITVGPHAPAVLERLRLSAQRYGWSRWRHIRTRRLSGSRLLVEDRGHLLSQRRRTRRFSWAKVRALKPGAYLLLPWEPPPLREAFARSLAVVLHAEARAGRPFTVATEAGGIRVYRRPFPSATVLALGAPRNEAARARAQPGRSFP